MTTGPPHWTGPTKDPTTDWLYWRATAMGHALTVVTGPGTDGFLWSVQHDGKDIPGIPGDHWRRWAQTLPAAQKAARDAFLAYAESLTKAARRIQTREMTDDER